MLNDGCELMTVYLNYDDYARWAIFMKVCPQGLIGEYINYLVRVFIVVCMRCYGVFTILVSRGFGLCCFSVM